MCGAAILLAAKPRRPCNGCRPRGTRRRIAGRWRITEAELWDCDGSLCGRIFFHLGDDSGFTAVREATEGRF